MMKEYILVVFWFCFYGTDCLQCYQCADTTISGDCQTDFPGMEAAYRYYTNNTETSDGKETPSIPPYYKKCSDSEKTCVIERVEFKGEMLAYIRDCSDGHTFSVTGTGRLNVSGGISTNNFTTCSYKENTGVVCITLCTGNMCNGPNTGSGSAGVPISGVLVVLIFWIYYITV